MKQNERSKMLPPEVLSAFCSQVMLMQEAGLTLYDGMNTLSEGLKETEEGKLYEDVARLLCEHATLHDALAADGRFPGYLVEMVGIGETTGNLQSVMGQLSEFYERETALSESIQHAVTYPIVLGVMLAAIVLIVVWKVMPVFRRVMSSMGVGMSSFAGKMMTFGTALGWASLAVIGVALLAAAACLVLLQTSKRKNVIEMLISLFPAIQRIRKQLAASRLSNIITMALGSGFSIEEALKMAPLALDDEDANGKITKMTADMEEGKPFPDALDESKIFEPMHNSMIRLGVAAGYENRVLSKLSETYEKEAENGIDKLISVIEPVMVAILTVVIGAILLSVILPMLGILKGLM